MERFWSHVVKGPGCWAWRGATFSYGYGVLSIGGKDYRSAHAISYALHYGKVPPNAWVLHSCDNPPCTNPKHLRLGTPKDNQQDSVRRGRKFKAFGNKFGAHTDKTTVLRIFKRTRSGERCADVARTEGVTFAVARAIYHGVRWADVTGGSMAEDRRAVRGERHYGSKLTDKQRADVANGTEPERQTAERYGISRALVRHIRGKW